MELECIRVVIRCRPMSENEKKAGYQKVVQMFPEKGEIVISNGSDEPPKVFTFDAVFNEMVMQKEIYEDAALPIVHNVFEGYNGTIFCYGQTGTGKTHTMEGDMKPKEMRGMMSRAFESVFEGIDDTSDTTKFLVRVSYLEIYKENIRDLLSSNPKNKLQLHEKKDSGVYVKDLSSFIVKSAAEIQKVQDTGRKNKQMASTNMNAQSSRSHSVFTIIVEISEKGPDGKEHIRMGKLNLVDLAGSERQSKTDASGQRLEEAIKINLSLTTLCQVIAALTDTKATYIPYRDSQLTRILQDSLGGNAKTVMCSNIGPADYNMDETINSLRWASRAKRIKNKPRINEDPKDAMLREFQDEIIRLREQLSQINSGADPSQLGIKGLKTVKEVEKVIEVKDEAKLKELEAKLKAEKDQIKASAEEERRRIEAEKNLAEEERVRLLEELRNKEESQEKSKTKQQELVKKLKKMEEKVLVGHQVIEEAKRQAKELKKQKKILHKEQKEKAKLEAEKQKKDDELVMINKKFTSLQEELDYITSKLTKVWDKYQLVQGEIQESQDEFTREKQDMYDTIFELDNQLKLKSTIINNFIPKEEVKKLNGMAKWNDELNDWQLKMPKSQTAKFQKKKGANRPVSAVGLKRPTSEYSRIAKGLGDLNPRYRFENILDLDLDMPERTTEDATGQPSERVNNAITMVLQSPDDESQQLDINQLVNWEDVTITEEQKKASRPKSAKRLKSAKKKKRVEKI